MTPPLTGCRVLELGSTVAGPYCGRLLADFGAEVIKVEAPKGDPVRDFGESYNGKSLYWASLSRNKKIISIDLNCEDGQEIVRRLASFCDIVIENFRPGTLDRWGLAYKQLSEISPGIIFVCVSGFGQDGPYSSRPGFGVVGEAVSGLRSLTGDPDRPPSRTAAPVTDYLAGVYAAFGAMMALYEKRRSGRGQYVDATLMESAFSIMEGAVPAFDKLGKVPKRAGSRLPGHAPNDLFPTRDGDFIHIAAGNPSTFRRLAQAMGDGSIASDPRFEDAASRNANARELHEIIEAWTSRFGLKELDRLLTSHGVPAAPIYTIADVFEDIHYKARDMLVRVDSDEVGPVTVAGVVPKLSATPGEIRWAGRPFGADTRSVLSQLLQMTDEEINRFHAAGVVGCAT